MAAAQWPVGRDDLRWVDRVGRGHASLPRLGSDGTVMTRHDDSQRSGRLAVTFGDLRVVDRFPAACDGSPLRVGWMRRQDGMMRHDAPGWRKRCSRLAVTRPVDHTRIIPPPLTLRTEQQLTAPADRPVRASAHPVPFTTAASVRGAGSAIAEPHPKQTTSVSCNSPKGWSRDDHR